ncbi:MAG: KAP family P-loop NTPase fold protein [Desulfovibrio sp.]
MGQFNKFVALQIWKLVIAGIKNLIAYAPLTLLLYAVVIYFGMGTLPYLPDVDSTSISPLALVGYYLLLSVPVWGIIQFIFSPIVEYSRNKREQPNRNKWVDTSKNTANPQISDDKPITLTPNNDPLERYNYCVNLAKSLNISSHGSSIVIGIEAKWGDGKTTVINTVKEVLDENYHPHIIDFEPWLYTSQEAMIKGFFNVFLESIKEEAPLLHMQIGGDMESFSSRLADLGKASGNKVVGGIMGICAAVFSDDSSLQDTRRRIDKALGNYNRTIVIVIDDIDRLPHEEVPLVFQLVKSIASFKGVAFLLAYDPDYVGYALGHGDCRQERIEEGRHFIEKIVQAPFTLPVFQQRHKLNHLHSIAKNDGLDNLNNFSRIISALTPTPRDTLRASNKYRNLNAKLNSIGKQEVHKESLYLYCLISLKLPDFPKLLHKYSLDYDQLSLSDQQLVEENIKKYGIGQTGYNEPSKITVGLDRHIEDSSIKEAVVRLCSASTISRSFADMNVLKLVLSQELTEEAILQSEVEHCLENPENCLPTIENRHDQIDDLFQAVFKYTEINLSKGQSLESFAHVAVQLINYDLSQHKSYTLLRNILGNIGFFFLKQTPRNNMSPSASQYDIEKIIIDNIDPLEIGFRIDFSDHSPLLETQQRWVERLLEINIPNPKEDLNIFALIRCIDKANQIDHPEKKTEVSAFIDDLVCSNDFLDAVENRYNDILHPAAPEHSTQFTLALSRDGYKRVNELLSIRNTDLSKKLRGLFNQGKSK